MTSLRTGIDKTPFVDIFVKPLISSSEENLETTTKGLPIFENKSYMENLNKLLSSKDLDECYDYDSKDKIYRVLYECLSARNFTDKTQILR